MVGDDFGAISGLNEWQGKLKYEEETYPVPFGPPLIPQDLSRALTRDRREWDAED
jgi:hypothetical protein